MLATGFATDFFANDGYTPGGSAGAAGGAGAADAKDGSEAGG